jgi:hypothetical protein
MGSTSNIELENIARYFNLPVVGIMQKDLLHDYDYVNNGFYIVNNQSSSTGSGSHWTALYLNKNTSFFFCSYGSPPSKEIVSFVKKYSKHLHNNNSIIQDLHSDNCGYYCIGFILFMKNNNYNHLKYIKAFVDDTRDNNSILEGLIRIYTKSKAPKELNRFFKSV